MIYLIKYNRAEGKLEYIEPFEDEDISAANDARLQAEISVGARNRNIEIVTLRASSEADLRLTHARYFRNAKELRELLRPR
jgi:hypothetical protein